MNKNLKDKYFQTIVVPIDYTEKSFMAIEHAIVYAERLNRSITLVYICSREERLFLKKLNQKWLDKDADLALRRLDILADKYRKLTHQPVYTFVDKGVVYRKIVDFAQAESSALIIIARNSESIKADKKYLGFQTSKIVKYAQCPVITVNYPLKERRCDVILLPLDLSKETTIKVNKAIEIARLFLATIKVVSAQVTAEKEVYDRLKKQIMQVQSFIEEHNIYCTSEIIRTEMDMMNSIPKLIVNYAEDVKADLVMIMTEKDSNWAEMFFGSPAQEIMRNAKMPVMSIVP